MKKKIATLGLVVSAFSITLAGCGTSSGAPNSATATTQTTQSKETNKPVIGVTLMTLTNPYFATMARALKAYGAQHGMQVVVEGANNSQSQQLQQVDAFIEQHVAAVIMAPPDASAAVSAVTALNKANIPVFTIDSNVDTNALQKSGGKIKEFVGSDNFKAGVIAGEEMAQYLNGKGAIGIVDFKTAQSVQTRDKGFFSVINKYPGIKVVSDLDGAGSTPGGLKAASEMLAAHPEIKAIYDINAPSGLGAVQAIKAANKVGQVAVIGLSGSQAAVQAIEDNSVFKFGAMQQPTVESKIAIENIDKYLHKQSIPPQVLTDIIKIDKQDAAKYQSVAYH
ncbi:substrate-binding domain-containing protein [Fodinisporobacter ferrooxydans]|uniref:Substrate-binding domain-containing protein n=1 Tax=Fodinisporobacter ferrooxydans TaxID=2901836 RepID=A0ABY4CHS3_9BACL|nr:substrate-binding domain-containing protein [Alicyclobacillaceae bacterium MYW30-H2]